MVETPSAPQGKLLLALASLAVLVGALVRFIGLDAELPLFVEPDPHIVHQVRLIEEEDPAPAQDPNWASYPHVTAQLTVALTDPLPTPTLEDPLEDHLEHTAWAVERVRLTVALLSLLLLPGTWLLARRFLDPTDAMVATALAMTSLLSVHFAGQARPHGAAAGAFALTLWASMRHARLGTWRSLLLMTACGALALGLLQSALALGFPVLAAIVLTPGHSLGRRTQEALVAVVGVVLSLLLWQSYLFGSLSGLGRDESERAVGITQGGHRLFLDMFQGEGIPTLLWSLLSWDPLLLVGLLLGLVHWWRSARGKSQALRTFDPQERRVTLSFVLTYGTAIALYGLSFERFLLPLMGVLATFAAYGLRETRRHTAGPVGVGLTLLALLAPTWLAVRMAQVRAHPSTYHQATEWVRANLEPTRSGDAQAGERLWLFRPVALGVWQDPRSTASDRADGDPRRRMLDWRATQRREWPTERGAPTYDLRFIPRYDRSGDKPLDLIVPMRKGAMPESVENPARYVDRLGSGLVLAEVYKHDRYVAGYNAAYAEIARRGELLARFSPDGDREGSPFPLTWQDSVEIPLPHRAWRLLFAECMGPTFELYRLP